MDGTNVTYDEEKHAQFDGESSGTARCICSDKDSMLDSSRMLKDVAKITEQQYVEISLIITILKGK